MSDAQRGDAYGVRIIAAMERIADKCVALLACLALVALTGEVDVVCVVALLLVSLGIVIVNAGEH